MPDNDEMVESTLPVNGIELCAETFGEPTDPPLLLIAGAASSMDWWEDEFCRRLAARGRYVIRYDHRDTGRSTSFPPGTPPYSDVDLAHDALGVLDMLGVFRAHVVGLSMGGVLAQRIAVERPHRVLSLTLMSTSPGPAPSDPAPSEPASALAAQPVSSPGAAQASPQPVSSPDAGLVSPAPSPASASSSSSSPSSASSPLSSSASASSPSPSPSSASASSPSPSPSPSPSSASASASSPSTLSASSASPESAGPDWSDRRSSVDRIIESALELGGPFTAEVPHLRRLAERIFDRTNDMAATQTNHFCCAESKPFRHLLGTITAPTLILHGTQDPMFPAAHAFALQSEIPGARLVWLEGVGHEFPPAAVWSQVIEEIIAQAARGRQPA